MQWRLKVLDLWTTVETHSVLMENHNFAYKTLLKSREGWKMSGKWCGFSPIPNPWTTQMELRFKYISRKCQLLRCPDSSFPGDVWKKQAPPNPTERWNIFHLTVGFGGSCFFYTSPGKLESRHLKSWYFRGFHLKRKSISKSAIIKKTKSLVHANGVTF